MTPYGMKITDIVTESAHVINGAIHYQNLNQNGYMMRPNDIFAGISSAYLEGTYNSTGMGGAGFTDTRIKLKPESVRSSRQNNLPANYVAKIVDNYRTSKQLAEFGQGDYDIFTRCNELTYEEPVTENPFIRAISNVKGIPNATSFTFTDLERLDPAIHSVSNYITLGATQAAQLHQVGQTSYWNGADHETLTATVLSNAVPAIMMDMLISKVQFRSTNHDTAGIVNTVLIDAKSMTNSDITQNLEIFKRRFEKEIMFDITYGNQELYMLEMTVDLFGDSVITLALGNNPPVTYSTPSFCDSLLTPVITTNKDNFFGVVHDFETIMNNLGSTTSYSNNMAINNLI